MSTQMQAAARSYRLNQTHEHCKTIYLYSEGTMEHTAVQLMSRKQRAAKLLTGDIGLTGLEALTEGEGGFEQALLDAIAKDEVLLDPSEMFKGKSLADEEDAAYWNIELAEETPVEISLEPLSDKIEQELPIQTKSEILSLADYLESVSLIYDEAQRLTLQAEFIALLQSGAEFASLIAWLQVNRFVFMGCEEEVAQRAMSLVELVPSAEKPSKPVLEILPKPEKVPAQAANSPISKSRKKIIDLMAIPDDETFSEKRPTRRPLASKERQKQESKQLAMF